MKAFLADPFRNGLILGLILLGLFLYFYETPGDETKPHPDGKTFIFFYDPSCPHCQRQKVFNQSLKEKYPALTFVEHDVTRTESAEMLADVLSRQKDVQKKTLVPVTVIGPYTFVGFATAETTGVKIEKAVQAYLQDDPTLYPEFEEAQTPQNKINLPFFATLHPDDYSLPVLAIIIGLADGFNPCAMWVLVYLISMVMATSDRRKIWILVGTFVLASGVLYFLFMTAWLNIFLFLGYLRPLTIAVGLFALGTGIMHLREYIVTKGEISCKVGTTDEKKTTMGRIERIVQAPLSALTLLSIIALAFIVNSIEFACSAGLPAIFTHTLSLRQLDSWQYYGYILLYDLFFMLDDLIIFSLAVLALNTTIGNRYAKHCKMIGGVTMILLGLVMLFKPEWLR